MRSMDQARVLATTVGTGAWAFYPGCPGSPRGGEIGSALVRFGGDRKAGPVLRKIRERLLEEAVPDPIRHDASGDLTALCWPESPHQPARSASHSTGGVV